MVAKSYQMLPLVSEPYLLSGKMYVKVQGKNGIKQVRWYTDKEYAKMYPEAKETAATGLKPQKDVLGFSKGYITIFKGNIEPYEDWFRNSICRYAKWWGWYLPSEMTMPKLPSGLTAVKLEWSKVSDDDLTVSKNETKIKNIVEALLYDLPTSSSEYIGNIGERLDLTLELIDITPIPSQYGQTYIYNFVDENQNAFVWKTGAKTLDKNKKYSLRGTIKEHKTEKNIKTTILTRCMGVKEI